MLVSCISNLPGAMQLCYQAATITVCLQLIHDVQSSIALFVALLKRKEKNANTQSGNLIYTIIKE